MNGGNSPGIPGEPPVIHERDWKKIPARWDFDSIREKSMKRTLKKLFKKDKLNVMLVFVFIIGLSVMLYPPISSYWNSKVQSRAVASYSNAVKSLTEEEKLIPTMKN